MEPFSNTTFAIDQCPFPLALIRCNDSEYRVIDANQSFGHLHEYARDEVCGTGLFDLDLFSTEIDPNTLSNKLREALRRASETAKPEKFFSSITSENANGGTDKTTAWLIEIAPLSLDDQKQVLLLSFHDISGLRDETNMLSQLWLEKEHTSTSSALEEEIVETDTQYKALNQELNNFMYSVSHDLRAPLRRIDGFSQELMNEFAQQLDETGAHYLRRIRQGAQDMGMLIDELLKLSRLSRRTVNRQQVDIGPIAHEVFNELYELENDRDIAIHIDEGLEANADPGLVKILLMNLLSNAIKFTSGEEQATITLGQTTKNGKQVFFIKDNGAGFDPAHSESYLRHSAGFIHSECMRAPALDWLR